MPKHCVVFKVFFMQKILQAPMCYCAIFFVLKRYFLTYILICFAQANDVHVMLYLFLSLVSSVSQVFIEHNNFTVFEKERFKFAGGSKIAGISLMCGRLFICIFIHDKNKQ